MIFDNRPPINFDNADQLASAERDGGAYDGVGFNVYRVYSGRRIHLVHLSSDGCDYGRGPRSVSTHLGCWESVDDLAAWLMTRTDEAADLVDVDADSRAYTLYPWWASELLTQLDVPGEEA